MRKDFAHMPQGDEVCGVGTPRIQNEMGSLSARLLPSPVRSIERFRVLLDCRRGVLWVAIVPFAGRWDRAGPLGCHPLFFLSVGTPGHQFFLCALLLLGCDFALRVPVQVIARATGNQCL